MDECQRLTNEVVQLQVDNDSQTPQRGMHPSHEQLMLLYSALDKLETDVDSMNQMVDIVFQQPQYSQNNLYAMNYSSGYGQGYRQREYDI